jgi:ferrous iron transport protein B
MNTSTVTSRSSPALFERNGKSLIACIGNPNVGKSLIFSLLTGKYASVSNYPGTTVEINRAEGKIEHQPVVFIDTPGINNFIPSSEEEKVTRDILLHEPVTAVLQIGDSKNLQRALFLSVQLAEMDLPFILNLNMWDELPQAGMKIDVQKLSSLLGVAVNPTIAIRKIGTDKIDKMLSHPRLSPVKPVYPELIEQALADIIPLLPELTISKRSLALMLLIQDESLRSWVNENLGEKELSKLKEIIWRVEQKISSPLNFIVTRVRYRLVDKLYSSVIQKTEPPASTRLSRLDRYLIHPLWGIPSLLLVLYLSYLLVGVFGAGTLVNFMQNTVFGDYINPLVIYLLTQGHLPQLVMDLLAGEYGILTMALTYGFAIVLPIVSTFFILFSILEDSGYLPRLALLVHNLFKVIGLNGKAVLPMVLGLGCDTMATMSARILETRRERIIVILLLALGVPCSAQLGILLGMLALLPWYAAPIWLGVITAVMITVGYLSSVLLSGKSSDFIIELPPLRSPQLGNIIIKTAARLEWYIKEVIPVFVLGTLILFIFSKIRILTALERLGTPLVRDFLGLPAKTTGIFLIGFLRRDYGAAGLYAMTTAGELTPQQVLVSMITITLFIPCIANLLMIIKELGLKTALAMALFIFPFAFLIGGVVNYLLTLSGIFL